MSRLTKWLLSASVFGVMFSAAARGQGTYTAATCNQSDVNAVINGPTHTAVNGDKIIIPAGSCSWSSGITISGKGINITGSGTPNTGGGTFGAGNPSTTLTETGSSGFFHFTGLSYGETAKVELLNLSTTNTTANSILFTIAFDGSCTSSGCANIRVDNINWAATAGQWYNTMESGGYVVTDNVFGVVDHNSTNDSTGGGVGPPLVEVNQSAWHGVGNYGDNSFASASAFGTVQELYLENNYMNGTRGTDNDVSTGGEGGARYVCRFNTVVNMSGTGVCSGHGTAWGGRMRGQRQVELYYNTVRASSCNVLLGLNSGTGYFFSNSFTGSGCNAVVQADIARFVQNQAPWNACDGTQPWDQYPWSSTTACLDQPGSGTGLLLQNATPVLASNPNTPCSSPGQCWPNPALDPMYAAGNVTPNNAPGITVRDDGSRTRVLANRAYYTQVSDVAQTSATSPFNGTSGTGYGTLAYRPTACTPRVGYWATDQGTWNTYNRGQEGTLYICTSTNTWTASYTPYTYPHPLETSGPAPNPPTNLTATPH